jgi:hypothetical protein
MSRREMRFLAVAITYFASNRRNACKPMARGHFVQEETMDIESDGPRVSLFLGTHNKRFLQRNASEQIEYNLTVLDRNCRFNGLDQKSHAPF